MAGCLAGCLAAGSIAREPRWGRNIEVPSEDSFMVGEYAIHFIKGFQEAPEDPASACCKQISTAAAAPASFARNLVNRMPSCANC